jgi:hypothetical protein
VSSKRRIRRRSCEGKQRHEDETGAVAHCKSLGWSWRAYRCKFCKGWHVGRPTKKAKMAMRARNMMWG